MVTGVLGDPDNRELCPDRESGTFPGLAAGVHGMNDRISHHQNPGIIPVYDIHRTPDLFPGKHPCSISRELLPGQRFSTADIFPGETFRVPSAGKHSRIRIMQYGNISPGKFPCSTPGNCSRHATNVAIAISISVPRAQISVRTPVLMRVIRQMICRGYGTGTGSKRRRTAVRPLIRDPAIFPGYVHVHIRYIFPASPPGIFPDTPHTSRVPYQFPCHGRKFASGPRWSCG